MGRKKDISLEEKTRIVCWAQEGVKTTEIAARLGRHPAAVRKHLAVLRKQPENAPPPPPKHKSGRPSKATAVMKESLRREVLNCPFKTARELKNDVPGWSDISVRRIQHILQKELDLPARRAAKKPLLTDKMVRKRLKFCKKYRSWTEKQWRDVMFSDEALFRVVNSRGRMVRRPSTVCRYKQRYVVATVKHSPGLMVWGCFSAKKGRGGLFFLPPKTTMNGEKYKKVLEHHLLPFMRIHKCKWFLQDGAPCHKSRLVMNRLKEMENEFNVMDWPGNSPDLNPIENVWSYMKYKLKNRTITSLKSLEDAIKEMWVKDMPLSYFQKLAASMPNRIRAVIKNQGQMTKY